MPEGFDFTDPDVYERRLPISEFAALRKSAPVHWVAQPPTKGGYADEGYWAVSRHEDVKEVSRNSEVYSTWENTAIARFSDDMPRETVELMRHLLINKDAPEHTKLRKVIARGFTPRAVQSLRPALKARAEKIVQDAVAAGSGDFVEQVACELPLQAIAELIGVPQEDRHKIFDWSNQMMGYDDPEFAEESATASAEILAYSYAMAEERRKCPAQDIVTTLVEADVDGDGLASEEFGFFVLLLAVAGTRRLATPLRTASWRSWTTPTSGSSTSVSVRRQQWTRSSVGPRRSSDSSERRWWTPNSAGRPSARATVS